MTAPTESVRNRHSLALRAVLLALFTLSQANATFNAPFPFSQQQTSTTSYVDFDDNNCASGAATLGGVVTNGGLGLSLNGSASMSNSNGLGAFSCEMNFVWQGTASGTIGTTATISASFSFTLTNISSFTCTLTVFANGNQVSQSNCVPSSGNTFTLTNVPFTVPANWTSYKVVLATTANLSNATLATFAVNVPGNSSIDIGTQGVTTPPVPTPASGAPALSPAALGITGIALVLLVGYATRRGVKAGT